MLLFQKCSSGLDLFWSRPDRLDHMRIWDVPDRSMPPDLPIARHAIMNAKPTVIPWIMGEIIQSRTVASR